MKFTSKDTHNHTHLSICVEVQDRLTSGFISVCVCEISSLVWDTNRPPSSLRGFLLCLLKVMDEQIRERERKKEQEIPFSLALVSASHWECQPDLLHHDNNKSLAFLWFISFLLSSSVQIKLNVKLISELLVRTDAVVLYEHIWSSSESGRALEYSMFYTWYIEQKHSINICRTQPHAYILSIHKTQPLPNYIYICEQWACGWFIHDCSGSLHCSHQLSVCVCVCASKQEAWHILQLFHLFFCYWLAQHLKHTMKTQPITLI